MASKISINLDTGKENYIVSKCKQNDDLVLEALIYENGLALDLTNKTITVQALKADGTYIIQSTGITKTNNKIIANLVRDFSRVPGTTKIEIVLVESSKQNTTFSFYLEVVGSVIKGAVQSGDTVTILEALENKIVEAGTVKQETEQLITSGNAATKGDVAQINASLEQNTNQMKANMFTNIKAIIPTDFQVTLPFDLIFDKNLNVTGHTWDLNQFKTNSNIVLYVNRSTGNDETGTGSIETPFKTPTKAWTYLQSATWTKALINVSGAFKRSGEVPSGWTIPSGKTLSIIGDNNTNFYSDKANLSTWTVDGNSYKTSRSSCYNVIDLTSTPDENGLYKPLTEVSSISICQNTLNSWYTDGTNVWVHTKDNRMPDINMELVVFSDALKFTLNSNSTLYLENIMKRGNIKVDGVNGSGRVVFNNVKTCCGGGSQSNGFDIDDVNDVYSFDCITAYNVDDGFNYHYINTTNPKSKLVFEYNCKGYENGTDTGDQATTCHEGVSNIRVNGTYTGKTGTALTDVQDCDTVLLGCKFTSTVGEAVNVSDTGSRLTMVNCLGYTQNPYKSIKSINARLRDNIVNQDVNITNAILI